MILISTSEMGVKSFFFFFAKRVLKALNNRHNAQFR